MTDYDILVLSLERVVEHARQALEFARAAGRRDIPLDGPGSVKWSLVRAESDIASCADTLDDASTVVADRLDALQVRRA